MTRVLPDLMMFGRIGTNLPNLPELPCLSQKVTVLKGRETKHLQTLSVEQQTWIESILTTASFLLFFGTLALCPILVFFAVFHAVVYHSILAIFSLLFLFTLSLFPRRIHTWPWFIRLPVWDMWRTYFNQTYIKTAEVPGGPRYIFAEWPHGVFMMGQWLGQSAHDAVFEGTGPTKGAAADATLAFPIMRQIYSWYGCVSASQGSLAEEVSRGYNLGICPGGIAELFMSEPEKEVVFF